MGMYAGERVLARGLAAKPSFSVGSYHGGLSHCWPLSRTGPRQCSSLRKCWPCGRDPNTDFNTRNQSWVFLEASNFHSPLLQKSTSRPQSPEPILVGGGCSPGLGASPLESHEGLLPQATKVLRLSPVRLRAAGPVRTSWDSSAVSRHSLTRSPSPTALLPAQTSLAYNLGLTTLPPAMAGWGSGVTSGLPFTATLDASLAIQSLGNPFWLSQHFYPNCRPKWWGSGQGRQGCTGSQ